MLYDLYVVVAVGFYSAGLAAGHSVHSSPSQSSASGSQHGRSSEYMRSHWKLRLPQIRDSYHHSNLVLGQHTKFELLDLEHNRVRPALHTHKFHSRLHEQCGTCDAVSILFPNFKAGITTA